MRRHPPERAKLWELQQAGRVKLERTDVLGTELLGADAPTRTALVSEAGELNEQPGPWVLGHSRLGHTVVASDEDEILLHEVFALLFPGRDWPPKRSRDVRDTMHVAWAIRFEFDGFVTEDIDLLNRAPDIRARFNLAILTPSEALAIAEPLGTQNKGSG